MKDINKKIICSKNDIILTKINNDFNISFKLKYNKNIFKFLDSKLFILIGELNKDQNEELVQTKQLLQELKFELNSIKGKEAALVQELQDNIPDVVDSKTFLKE